MKYIALAILAALAIALAITWAIGPIDVYQYGWTEREQLEWERHLDEIEGKQR